MAGDRRRTSHSIDVSAALALQPTSRKRGPSYVHEDSDSFQFGNDEEMDECNAALILMKLSNSPKSPKSPKNAEKWLGSSPGSSSASWSSGSSSPPLSEEDGQTTHSSSILRMDAAASARIRTTSVSTSDEGIVMDYNEDAAPRKRRANKPTFKCIWKGCDFIEHTSKKIERHIRNAHLGNKKARRSADYDGSFSESDHEEEFYYTEIEDDDDDAKVPSPSQPTLSHRDMARPPHEDPEYQRQIVGNFKQGRAAHSQAINGQVPHTNRSSNKSLNHVHQSHVGSVGPQQSQMQLQHHNAACMPTSPLAHHNYTWPSTASVAVPSPATAALTAVPQQHSPVSIMKHARCSPRPSATTAPYRPYVAHHHNNHHQQQQQYSSISSNGSSGGGDSKPASPHLHNNNSASANSVLQQLSQQNVTVTTHQSGDGQQQQLHGHQQHPLSAVTITPNYQHHATHQTPQTQQHMRHSHHQQSQQQQQSTTTASNIVANVAAPNHHAHSPHQHHTASHTHSTQQQQLQLQQPQHVAVQHATAATRQAPNSPNRRTRGENKKCRKVYGMDRRDQWCTQCKWKKACSRFGD